MGYVRLLAGDGGNIITKYIIILFGENYTSDEKRTENAAAATTAYYYYYYYSYILYTITADAERKMTIFTRAQDRTAEVEAEKTRTASAAGDTHRQRPHDDD